MIMYKILLLLFIIANILSLAISGASYILTIVAKSRKSSLATAKIAFPAFAEVHSLIKNCFWSGTIFIALDWLLCSSSILSTEATSTTSLSQALLKMATVWAIMIFVGIIAEIIIRFIKSTGSNSYSLFAGIKSSICYAVIYFVLSFLIS